MNVNVESSKLDFIKNFSALIAERDRLVRINNKRIKLVNDSLQIDLWCNGNEEESNKISQITRKLDYLVKRIKLCSIGL